MLHFQEKSLKDRFHKLEPNPSGFFISDKNKEYFLFLKKIKIFSKKRRIFYPNVVLI